MTTFLQYTLAGVAGLVALKLVGGLLFPLLGLAVGLVGLAVKIAFVVFVGWFVLRTLRGREPTRA